MSKKIQIVFGPTASGKTEFGVDLAHKLGNAEIVNADSMQIYKEIPIITNQPTEFEKNNIEHHLFSYKSILDHSDMAKWLEDSVPLIKSILAENKTPILVGGTGMYLKSIVEGVSEIPKIPTDIKVEIQSEIQAQGIKQIYDKLCSNDPNVKTLLNEGDTQRISRAYEVFRFTNKSIYEWNKLPNKTFFESDSFDFHFVERNRQEIYDRINSRFNSMVENGVLEEAKKAHEVFVKSRKPLANLNLLPAYKAHGLREIIAFLNGDITQEEAICKAQQVTRNYAKRQFTWWRGWSKSLRYDK